MDRSNEKPRLDLEGLPCSFDAVVLGTALCPSLLAAGAAFSGKRVLHLDANDFYGGLDDAGFTLEQTIEWAEKRIEAQRKLIEGACNEEVEVEEAGAATVVREAEDHALLEKVRPDKIDKKAPSQPNKATVLPCSLTHAVTTPRPAALSGRANSGHSTASVKQEW